MNSIGIVFHAPGRIGHIHRWVQDWFFLLLLRTHALAVTLLEQLSAVKLLHLDALPSALFLVLVVLGLLLRARKQIDIFYEHLDRGAAEIGPGNDKCQFSQVAVHDIDGQLELVERLAAQFEIAKLDIARPDANLELCGIKVLDVHAQEAVEQTGYESFQHGGRRFGRDPGRGEVIGGASEACLVDNDAAMFMKTTFGTAKYVASTPMPRKVWVG